MGPGCGVSWDIIGVQWDNMGYRIEGNRMIFLDVPWSEINGPVLGR